LEKYITIDLDEELFTSSDGKTFTDGIAYAKYIRKELSRREPIMFESIMPEDKLLDPNSAFYINKAEIINAVGHVFIKRAATTEEREQKMKRLRSLTPTQLLDIQRTCCDYVSTLTSSFHDFKGEINQVNRTVQDISEKNDKLYEIIKFYKEKLNKDYSSHPEIIKTFEKFIQDQRETDFKNINSEDDRLLTKHLDDNIEEDEKSRNQSKKPFFWKVLFLDDNPGELTPVLEGLDSLGLDFVVCTSVSQAKNEIKKDVNNRICVAVSDLRLYELQQTNQPYLKRMQLEQGYDFLSWLNNERRFNGMISLSGMGKALLDDPVFKRKLPGRDFKKKSLDNGGHSTFIDYLVQLGEENYKSLINQPGAKSWSYSKVILNLNFNDGSKKKITRTLKYDSIDLESITKIIRDNTRNDNKQLKAKVDKVGLSGYEIDSITSDAIINHYISHRNSKAYETDERKINEEVEEIARKLEWLLDNNFSSGIKQLNLPQGGLETNLKEVDKDNQKFLDKLKFRRIIFYLQIKGFHKETIIHLLQTGDLADKNEIDTKKVNGKLASLAIQYETDIPNQLLVEEKLFLHNYMNIPIYQIEDMTNQLYTIINQKINSSNIDIQSLNEPSCARYIVSGMQEIKAISFNDSIQFLKNLNKHPKAIGSQELNELILDCKEIVVNLSKNFNSKYMLDSIRELEILLNDVNTKVEKSVKKSLR